MQRLLIWCRNLIWIPIIGSLLLTLGCGLIGILMIITRFHYNLFNFDYSPEVAKKIGITTIETLDLFLIATIVMMIPTGILGIVSVVEDPDAMIAMFIVGFIAIVTLVLCLLYLAVGYGLWTLKSWARVAALALAVVSLFGVPIGTITGGLTLWYLMQPEVAAKFEQG